MSVGIPAPGFDPELEAALALLAGEFSDAVTREGIPKLRALASNDVTKKALAELGLLCRDVTITGYEGASLVLTIVQRSDHEGFGPGILHSHGGGMIAGCRMDGVLTIAPWIREYDAVAVTAEYRLAPEFPDPYPIEDSYAALLWMVENAASLGIDSDQIVLAGASAGGGLSAGLALLARDRCGPPLLGQVLDYPMLDDRHSTVSARQIDGLGFWDRQASVVAWEALLGERYGTDNVSPYAAPARATDLTGLPPAFISCGSMEVFRDECVTYASGLWEAGVQAELHVWAGAFHGFDTLAAHTAIAHSAIDARGAWIDRLIGN